MPLGDINISSNFSLSSQRPLDDRLVLTDLTERDAMDIVRRYNLMDVRLVSTGESFRMILGTVDNDLSNDNNWVEIFDSMDPAEYYTKINLQTSGQSTIHWGNLNNVPSTFVSTWGTIIGTLSNQVDLQNTFNSKKDTFTENTGFNKDFGVLHTTVAYGDHSHIGVYEPANSNIQAHIINVSNPHNITKTTVGLANVDNTSDISKPISTVTQTALDLKVNSILVGAINGVAELDASGHVPASQLPSYVDEVLEYADLASFPVTGETGKIYIALDTNLTYRWSGSAYIEISASLALGETSSTAYRGDRGAVAYAHSQLITGNPHSVLATELTDFDVEVANNPTVITNTAKTSNIPTILSTGTRTATTYGINSDGSSNDVILAEATTSLAGLLGASKWNEIVANTSKISSPWTISGSYIYYNNRVGVDISPLSLFHINGELRTSRPGVATQYMIFNTSSSGHVFDFYGSKGVTLRNESNTGIVIDTIGNVGIGTTVVPDKFMVQNDSISGYITTFQTSEGKAGIRFYLDGATGAEDKGALILLGDPSATTWVTKVAIDSRDGGDSYFNSGGNVGLNTDNPDEVLHAEGNIRGYNIYTYAYNSTSVRIGSMFSFYSATSSAEYAAFGNTQSEVYLKIYSDGHAGINDELTADDFLLSSDRRLKSEINYDLNDIFIDGLKPTSFLLNGKFKYGFIAQDMLETHPELVNGTGKEKENGEIDYYSIKENSILPIAVKEIQQLKRDKLSLEERMEVLEAALHTLLNK